MDPTPPFDNLVRRWSLNSALLMIVLSSVWFGVAICQIIKYAKSRDDAGLFLGLCGTFLSLVGIVLFIKMVHAVVRRMRATPHETI